MPKISTNAEMLPASAIRKLVPFSDAAKAQGVKVYHLNVGAPDIKSPQSAIDAVKNIDMDHFPYSHSAGDIKLRKALVEKYYKKIGIDLDVSEILINIAGSESVIHSIQITCDPGDEIIVAEPYYTNYYTMARETGVEIKVVKTDIRDGFKIPGIEAFEELITPKTKAILISNPGNPTGTLYPKEALLKLGEICKKHDLFLISDEVYREFCYTDEPFFSALNIPGLEQNVILADSVSKRYNLCGLRIGCIASHNKDVMTAALKYAQARLCPPVLGQIATIGAIDAPQSYFDETKAEYIRRRDCAVNALNKMEGVFSPVPMGAFYTIAELPVDDAESFAKWMISEFRVNNETVLVTPAASFYKDPSRGKKHIRIAYVLEVPELEKAMAILEAGLKAYPGRTI